jgi:branched-chain amino acid transport system substrate-binding protein
MYHLPKLAVGLALVATAFAAHADIKVGVVLSATGPAASLGIPEKNVFALLPKDHWRRVGRSTSSWTTRPTRARPPCKNIAQADRAKITVDAVIGSTVTPSSLAMTRSWHAEGRHAGDLAGGLGRRSCSPPMAREARMGLQDRRRTTALMAERDRRAHGGIGGVKTVGFIGFADAYGDSWYKVFSNCGRSCAAI